MNWSKIHLVACETESDLFLRSFVEDIAEKVEMKHRKLSLERYVKKLGLLIAQFQIERGWLRVALCNN